jgi:hypothetical protein
MLDSDSRGAGRRTVAFPLTAGMPLPRAIASAVAVTIMIKDSEPPDEGAEDRHIVERNEAQIAARGHYASELALWNGQNSAAEDLNKAAAAHLAALKNALTPELETALRDLEAGKVSTLATAKIFRSAPHVLDMLWPGTLWPGTRPGTPLIQKVRQLVQMLNAPQEWDGYLEDKFWTLGQTILWLLTRDPWVVDQASNDTGDQGEIFGEIKAAILIDLLNLQREDVQDAAKKLRRRCLNGLAAIDGQDRPIPEIEWRHLRIVLHSDNTPCIVRRGQSSIVSAYPEVVFLRAEVLREFPLEGQSEDQDVTAPPPSAEAIEPAGQDDAVEAEQSTEVQSDSTTDAMPAASSDGAAVRIEIEPYPIEKENPNDTPQIRLARWVAWQRWPDGQIPRMTDIAIQAALNKKLKELYNTKLPLELKGDVKGNGLSLSTVRRLLGKRKD